ncbi:MAG TPA: SAM-dependent methyltransferase, partial [Halothiobacillaceae bacterium]|nr:SAM-dependent methyltransferase [Halothiobacillaceae bacterium]
MSVNRSQSAAVAGSPVSTRLPVPDHAEQEKSIALIKHIIARMQAEPDQTLSFAQYMDELLYHPQWGYYSSGQVRFGKDGDFITAPERSPLFARGLLCEWLASVDEHSADFVEYGAGSGQLAVDLLPAMEQAHCLPERYFIIERSAALIERQRARFSAALPAHLAEKVCFISRLDQSNWQGGMIVANEVLDALACERLKWRYNQPDTVKQMRVGFDGQRFVWSAASANEEIVNAMRMVSERLADRAVSDSVYCELNLQAPVFLQDLFVQLQAEGKPARILLFDYGGRSADVYNPERADGTLRCHFRHLAHNDPFVYPGLQDITAWVDFEQIQHAAQAAGFEQEGWLNQGQWLLKTSVPDELANQMQQTKDQVQQIRLAQQLRDLV